MIDVGPYLGPLRFYELLTSALRYFSKRPPFRKQKTEKLIILLVVIIVVVMVTATATVATATVTVTATVIVTVTVECTYLIRARYLH